MFNDKYDSIDECLSEIFDKLNRKETKFEKKEDKIIVKVPLYNKYSKKYYISYKKEG